MSTNKKLIKISKIIPSFGIKTSHKLGPDFESEKAKNIFFDEYKKSTDYRITKSLSFWTKIYLKQLETFLKNKKNINALLLGCSYWENARYLSEFIRKFNRKAHLNIAAIDVYPEPLEESIEKRVQKHLPNCNYFPWQAPAQDMPFQDNYFDLIINLGIFTCSTFDQHEPIIKETARVLKYNQGRILSTVSDPGKIKKRKIIPTAGGHLFRAYIIPTEELKKLFTKEGLKIMPDTVKKFNWKTKNGKIQYAACFIAQKKKYQKNFGV